MLVAGITTGGYFMLEGVEITLASGLLVATQGMILVNGEGDANDELVTIDLHEDFTKAGYQPILLLKAAPGITITIKHGTGNMSWSTGADFSLTGERTVAIARMSLASDWNDL